MLKIEKQITRVAPMIYSNDNWGFKPIPYFRRYEISADGKVINLNTNKLLTPVRKGIAVNLMSDQGHRTTRTIKGLLDETWNKGGRK